MAIDVLTSDNLVEFTSTGVHATQEKPVEDPKPVETESSVVAEETDLGHQETEAAAEDTEVAPVVEEEHKKPSIKDDLRAERTRRKEAIRRAEEAERLAQSRAEENEALRKKFQAGTPVTEEKSGKPDPSTYTDAFKYAEDLSDWKVKEAFRVREETEATKHKEEETVRVRENWNTQTAAARTEYEDFDDVIEESADIKISNNLRDAIVESDIGPKLQYYIAKNPAEAERLNSLSVTKMLREVGKIEASLEKSGVKETVKTPLKSVEVKTPPKPISPIRGGSAPIENHVDSDGEFKGTLAQYKKLRAAGKI